MRERYKLGELYRAWCSGVADAKAGRPAGRYTDGTSRTLDRTYTDGYMAWMWAKQRGRETIPCFRPGPYPQIELDLGS